MTLKDLYLEVFDDIDESPADSELLAKIKRYLNRAYKEVAKRELLEKSVVRTVSGGSVTLPMDCFQVAEVMQEGICVKYYINGKKLFLEEDGEYTINYFYIPEPMEYDDDETVTNPANDEFIGIYAKWLYFVSEGYGDEARYFKNEIDGFRIAKSKMKITKTIDVYGVGEYV